MFEAVLTGIKTSKDGCMIRRVRDLLSTPSKSSQKKKNKKKQKKKAVENQILVDMNASRNVPVRTATSIRGGPISSTIEVPTLGGLLVTDMAQYWCKSFKSFGTVSEGDSRVLQS